MSGEQAGVQLVGLGVVGVEVEGGLDFAGGAGDVVAAEQGDGEVEVVVGVVGVGGDDLLEERDGVLALAAEGDALVVDDFGQGQAAGDEGEGGLGLGVFGDVEAGEAAVEAGFEGDAIGGGNLGERGGGGFILAGGVLLLAEGEQGGGVVGGLGDGGFEALSRSSEVGAEVPRM